MRTKRLFLTAAWLAVVIEMASIFPVDAAPANEALTIGYSSFSGHYVPLWIAVEDRLGRKYGLDLKAVYAGRARPQQLLMSGETPLVVATGTGALTSHVLGVKDQVIILTFVNRVPGVIVSKPEIKTPEDLRGKVIGTGRPGALADTMVRYVLRSKMNLVPDRDVKLCCRWENPLWPYSPWNGAWSMPPRFPVPRPCSPRKWDSENWSATKSSGSCIPITP